MHHITLFSQEFYDTNRTGSNIIILQKKVNCLSKWLNDLPKNPKQRRMETCKFCLRAPSITLHDSDLEKLGAIKSIFLAINC